MMLHQQTCPHCEKKNIYYDENLNVSKKIEEDVSKILETYHKKLGMTNQSKREINSPTMVRGKS